MRNASQLLELGLLALFGLFVLILTIATVSGVVYAIRDSVKQRRHPPILSIVLWGVFVLLTSIRMVLVSLYQNRGICLILFGRLYDFWNDFLLLTSFLALTTATCYYVFLAFRTRALPAASTRRVSPAEHAIGEDTGEEDEEYDEDEAEEKRRFEHAQMAAKKRNWICRALSIAVSVALNALMVGIVVLTYTAFHYEHNLSAHRSPDGERVIYVDNATVYINTTIRGSTPRAMVYEEIAPGVVVQLRWEPGSYEQTEPRTLAVEEDQIQWKGDRIRFTYGNTYADYLYYGVSSEGE